MPHLVASIILMSGRDGLQSTPIGRLHPPIQHKGFDTCRMVSLSWGLLTHTLSQGKPGMAPHGIYSMMTTSLGPLSEHSVRKMSSGKDEVEEPAEGRGTRIVKLGGWLLESLWLFAMAQEWIS
jgi:hypothetical protein